MADLSELFAPSRVAVIGATEREGAVGRAVMDNLHESFDGDIVPVNPNAKEVLGLPCVPDVASTGDVDLAVVVVPAPVALTVVREAAEAGVENVVVISAGFGEAGGEGVARERELETIATEYDLNLVGPNCIGVLSTPTGLNATFGPTNALSGSLSFMSQSGAIITSVLDWANDQGIGFKDVVSLGNKTVLDETDFLEAWDEDPDTDVILAYLESIEDGQAFIEQAREVTQTTPVLVAKSGRTDAGAKAAASHTGAIAGSDRAYDAGLAQAGVLRVDSLEDLFDFAQLLAGQPLPDSTGVGIVTNAGGAGVLATDAIGESNLSLASFIGDTHTALEDALPKEASHHNPVDVIGDADAARFRRALELVLADENVGAVAVLSAPSAVLSYDDLAEEITSLQEESNKPMVACLMGGARTESAARRLREHGVPNYFDPARAIESLDALAASGAASTREYEPSTPFDVDRERAEAVLSQANARRENRLGVEAMDLLSAYGIQTPASEIVETPSDAADVAAEIGAPVVMKIVSPDILHKSDIGGVKVGVEETDVRDAFEDLVTRAYNYQPDATVLGVQVQEMVDTGAGVETIVGMTRDPQFGPLLMFGLGGIFVEVFEDTAFRVAPVSEHEAREMTHEIDAAPLLRGARGRKPIDVDAGIEVIQRLSQLVTDFPEILELDINPLVLTPERATAIDIRLTLDQDHS
jgi:acetyltransferase